MSPPSTPDEQQAARDEVAARRNRRRPGKPDAGAPPTGQKPPPPAQPDAENATPGPEVYTPKDGVSSRVMLSVEAAEQLVAREREQRTAQPDPYFENLRSPKNNESTRQVSEPASAAGLSSEDRGDELDRFFQAQANGLPQAHSTQSIAAGSAALPPPQSPARPTRAKVLAHARARGDRPRRQDTTEHLSARRLSVRAGAALGLAAAAVLAAMLVINTMSGPSSHKVLRATSPTQRFDAYASNKTGSYPAHHAIPARAIKPQAAKHRRIRKPRRHSAATPLVVTHIANTSPAVAAPSYIHTYRSAPSVSGTTRTTSGPTAGTASGRGTSGGGGSSSPSSGSGTRNFGQGGLLGPAHSPNG